MGHLPWEDQRRGTKGYELEGNERADHLAKLGSLKTQQIPFMIKIKITFKNYEKKLKNTTINQ